MEIKNKPMHLALAHGDTRGIVAYLLLAFGISWACWIPLWLLHIPAASDLYQVAIMAGAFGPAAAAIIVRLFITREGLGDAGLKPNLLGKWPYYVFAWVWPLLLVAGLVVLAMLSGVVIPQFSLPPDAIPQLSDTGLYGSLLPMVLISTLIFWCEELGWRGYLQIRLFSDRPLLAAVAVGAIWGVWHYPAVMAGYMPNNHGLVGLALLPLYTIMFSIVLGWLRLRTGSVWAPTLAHAANNVVLERVGPILAISIGMGDLLFSPPGTLVMVLMAVACAGIVVTGGLSPARATKQIEYNIMK